MVGLAFLISDGNRAAISFPSLRINILFEIFGDETVVEILNYYVDKLRFSLPLLNCLLFAKDVTTVPPAVFRSITLLQG